ncbi:MAG: hypothetical protein RIM84_03530 [Alphaproteobacteria bacterium]
MKHILPVAVLALLLTACAAPRSWHRANTAADQASFDLQTCRSLARGRLSADPAYTSDRATADASAADAAGRGDGSRAIRQRWAEAGDRRTLGRLVDDCMARKGYRLGPAPVSGTAA